MKILNSCRIARLQAQRNLLFWILLIAFYAYAYFCFYHYTVPGDYNAGSALAKLSFLVQGGILVFLFLGVIFNRSEELHGLNDLISTIPGAHFSKAAGKLLFYLFLTLFLCTTAFLLFASRIYLTGTDFSEFYWSSYKYIFLYWCFTFYISLLLGVLFSLWIKGKFIYPVLLFIWTLIGPMNEVFIGNTSLQLSIADLPMWLSLGDPNPHADYNALYGFAISHYHWMKHSIVFVVVVILILLTLINNSQSFTKKKYYKPIGTAILLFCILFYGLTLDRQLYLSNDSEETREFYEQTYYEKDRSFGSSTPNVKTTNYDISLEINRLLYAEVSFSLANEEKKTVKEAVLSLYHGFNVKNVIQHNKALSFSQKNDFIKVKFKKPLKPGEKVRIAMRYAGKSSPLFFANEQAIYLPYYFPWLPSALQKPAFTPIAGYGLSRVNHQTVSPTSYKLSYKGTGPLYSNLKQASKNHWEGMSPQGLTLVSGELTDYNMAGTRFIEPNTWTNNLSQYNEFQVQTEKIINNISEITDQNLKMPKTIMYFPILSTSDSSFEEFMWYGGDHLIYGVPLINGETILPNRFIYTYWIVPALTWKHAGIQMTKDPDYIRSFDQIFAYVYNKKYYIQDDGAFLPSSIKGHDEKRKALKLVLEWIKTNGQYDRKLEFCKDWFDLIKQNADWTTLIALIEKYNKAEVQ